MRLRSAVNSTWYGFMEQLPHDIISLLRLLCVNSLKLCTEKMLLKGILERRKAHE